MGVIKTTSYVWMYEQANALAQMLGHVDAAEKTMSKMHDMIVALLESCATKEQAKPLEELLFELHGNGEGQTFLEDEFAEGSLTYPSWYIDEVYDD